MIIGATVDNIYRELMTKILDEGKLIFDKGVYYQELLGESFKLINPRSRIIQNSSRKISLAFQLAECVWIFSGHNDLDMIANYAPSYKNFSDDGKTLHGAYGKRLRNWQGLDQFSNIINFLKEMPSTRQAVLTIFDPLIDLTIKTKDVPCNDLLQFFIRDNKLHLVVYVRSQDMILGLPYDLFHWTIFQEFVANRLNVGVGEYITHYGSVHIYQKDFDKALNICNEAKFLSCSMESMPKQSPENIFELLYEFESKIRNGQSIDSKLDSWWHEWLLVFALKNKNTNFMVERNNFSKSFQQVLFNE